MLTVLRDMLDFFRQQHIIIICVCACERMYVCARVRESELVYVMNSGHSLGLQEDVTVTLGQSQPCLPVHVLSRAAAINGICTPPGAVSEPP